MKVLRPTNNPLTQGYSDSHRGYDFAGRDLPDEVRAGMDGLVVETVNLYNTSWINNGTLTTKDYGNYMKIRHTDGSFELHAHLKKDSLIRVGTQVKQGDIIARIGNTGNSTGFHVHSEFRNSSNTNIEVEFITNLPINMEDKRLADEFRKLTKHNGAYIDAASVLKALSDKDGVIGRKDDEIRRLGEANGKLAQQLAEFKLRVPNDNEFTKLGRSFAENVKKAQSL